MSLTWIVWDLKWKAQYVAIDVRLFSLKETLEMCFYDGVMKSVHIDDNDKCVGGISISAYC